MASRDRRGFVGGKKWLQFSGSMYSSNQKIELNPG